MDSLFQDIKFGLRSLAKRPDVTVLAAVALALGIGACTAIFSVVHGVLLRPLPFEDSDRIVIFKEPDEDYLVGFTSPANYLDMKAQAGSYVEMAGYRRNNFNLIDEEGPERIMGASVSPGFFTVFGAEAITGRTFRSGEDENEQGDVVVLSYALWQRRYGGDSGIIGSVITLSDRPHTIVGVMPPEFDYPSSVGLWVRSYQYGVPEPPFSFGSNLADVRGLGYFQVAGRLKEGTSLEQADTEMAAIIARLVEEYPDNTCNETGGVISIREVLFGDVNRALVVLMVAVAFVLLIACANVANLLLARALGREREMAVRGALGAGRRLLVQQLLVESVLLALVGGVMGIVFALCGIKLLVSLGPSSIYRLGGVGLDITVLLFCTATSMVTGLLFGLVPALNVSRTDLQSALREGGFQSSEGARRRRTRELLVVGEVALAFILLVGAALMIRSMDRLQRVDPGFDTSGIAVGRVNVPESRYPEEEQMYAFCSQVLERIRTLPGVETAGAVMDHPMSGGVSTLTFVIDGRPEPEPGEEPVTGYQVMTPGYLETLRIPLLKGRDFTDLDGANAPRVAVVNEAMARRFFPDEEPLGRRIAIGDMPDEDSGWATIVGVAGNVRHFNLSDEAGPEVYIPFAQDPWPFMSFVARSRGETEPLISAMRGVVLDTDPDQPVYGLNTMERVVANNISAERFVMLLMGIFALTAAILASVGLYGVISYSVGQRTQEIGIRIALGASHLEVLRLVVRQGMLPALAGIVVGAAGALAATRLLASLLFEVSTTDPTSFFGITLLVLLTATLAVSIPSFRAIHIDPIEALRYE